MTAATVLISSAGRRVELLRGFRSALDTLGLDGRVLAVDRSPLSSALQTADEGFLVPSCDDPAFVPEMLELCHKHSVDLVVPTIDPELPVYAAARDEFSSAGTTVAVGSAEVVAIAADKSRTHEWLTGNGFPTVGQATPGEVRADPPAWPFPLVVKPRHGSAAIGFCVVNDVPAFDLAVRAGDVVVQTVAPGVEYTVDVLVERSGRCVCAVPRRRLEVRAGEVSKAVTMRSAELEALAVAVSEALPGAYGVITLQIFRDDDTARMAVIEMNARFGGGFPLSREAGADFPRWLLEEVTGMPSSATTDGWRDGLVMLRYDAAVFLDDAEEAR
jgi:carbamoyl-phosphate synthase large subunit